MGKEDFIEIMSNYNEQQISLSQNSKEIKYLWKLYYWTNDQNNFIMNVLEWNSHTDIEKSNIYLLIIYLLKNKNEKINKILENIKKHLFKNIHDDNFAALNCLLYFNLNEKECNEIYNSLKYDQNSLRLYVSEKNYRELYEKFLCNLINNIKLPFWNQSIHIFDKDLRYINKSKKTIEKIFNELWNNIEKLARIYLYSYSIKENSIIMSEIYKKIPNNIAYKIIKNTILYDKEPYWYDNNFIWQEEFQNFLRYFWEKLWDKELNECFLNLSNIWRTLNFIDILKWLINNENIEIFFKYNWEINIIDELIEAIKKDEWIKEKHFLKKIEKKYKKELNELKLEYKKNLKLKEKREQERKEKIKKEISEDFKKWNKELRNWKIDIINPEFVFKYRTYKDYLSESNIKTIKTLIDEYFKIWITKLNNMWEVLKYKKTNTFTIPQYINILFTIINIWIEIWYNFSNNYNYLIYSIPYYLNWHIIKTKDYRELFKKYNITIKSENLDYILDCYDSDKYWKDLKYVNIERIIELIEKNLIKYEDLKKGQKDRINKILKNFYIDKDKRITWTNKRKILEVIKDNKNKIITIDQHKEWINKEYELLYNKYKEYNYYTDFLTWSYDDIKFEEYSLLIQLNSILIKYKNKDAIKRRFDQLLKINTPVYLEYSGELMRWCSRYESEIFWLNKSQRFYHILINKNIKLTDYNNKIIEILTYANNLKDNDRVKSYIFYFVKEFINNQDSYNKNNVYAEYEKFKDFIWYFSQWNELTKYDQLEIKYKKCLMECQKLKSENRKIKNELNKDNRVYLYVEWKCDKKYLEHAYKKLYKRRCPYEIIICWWAPAVSDIILNKIGNCSWIHIWIYDIDDSWIEWWLALDHKSKCTHDVDNGNNDNYDIREPYERVWRIFEYKNWCSCWYYANILLPIIDSFKDQIFSKDSDIQKSENNGINFLTTKNIKKNNNKFSSHYTIECLVKCDENSKYFNNNKGYFKVSDELKNKCLDFTTKKPINNKIRDNFKPIFNYINNIKKEMKL